MRVGLLVTGDTAVRAAHSLQAQQGVDDVVVIGPAKSKSFQVADSADGCDFLVGAGETAPRLARKHRVPLIWDGDGPAEGVSVWGAAPAGLALALAAREPDPRLVALAHPAVTASGTTTITRFPDPIGRVSVGDGAFGGRPIGLAHSPNAFAACLALGSARRVAIVDDGAFMSGVALAAGVACLGTPGPVWDSALAYLETATQMGLVMAESGQPI